MTDLISVDLIEANAWNPNVMNEEEYQALKQDMQIRGPRGVDPILVSIKSIFYSEGSVSSAQFSLGEGYVIIDGEHRWRAAKELGWKDILCSVESIQEDEAKGLCYRRNRERGNIDPFKEANLFKSEVERQRSQKEIAEKYLVDRSTVAHRLSLLKLDAEVVKSVAAVPRGTIKPSHLEPIASLESEDQKRLVKSLVQDARVGHIGTVNDISDAVARIKEGREEERLLAEALKTAKFPKCPKCHEPPERITYKKLPWVQCGKYHDWNLETGKTPYQEEYLEERTLDGKRLITPSSVLRSMHTVKELSDIFGERIKEVIPHMDKIHAIRVSGMLDDSEFQFDLNSYGQSTSIYVRHGGNDKGFRVEEHEYRGGEKSAVHCGTSKDIEKVKAFIEAAFQGKLDIEPRKLKKRPKT